MGLYNRVIFETKCPTCNEVLSNFQSKDRNPDLRWVTPDETRNFYTICYCGTHLLYKRSRAGSYKMITERIGDAAKVRSGHAKVYDPKESDV